MTTVSPETIERARERVVELEREAAEEQMIADALRAHADEHSTRAERALRQLRRLGEQLAVAEGVTA